jgi:DNA polymerase/3'-5' exonuclease PolX
MGINDIIIAELLETSKYYESKGDEGRSTAYKRAVDSIEKYGIPITSGDEAKQLKWIGDGIAAKIDSILAENPHVSSSKSSKSVVSTTRHRSSTSTSDTYNKRKKLEIIKQDVDEYDEPGGGSSSIAVTLIDNIRSTAAKNQQRQQQSTEDKSKSTPKPTKDLNRSSRTLRIKQYEFAKKPELDASVVSRTDLDQFIGCVRRAWDKIVQKESSRQERHSSTTECCGSFRRQQAWCHECVILLKSTVPFQRQKVMFQDLIKILEKVRLLDGNHRIAYDYDYYQGVLDVSKMYKSTRTGDYPDKQTNIPIVLRLVESESWPCALLRWTGPIAYWVKLQSTAAHRGYKLTEHGLYLDDKRAAHPKRLYHRDEYDVMNDLDMEYLEPMHRK